VSNDIVKQEVFAGIWVYKNQINKNIIDNVENFLKKYPDKYNWAEATVGYAQKVPSYRDCVDFKIQNIQVMDMDNARKELNDIWQYAYDMQINAVKDYCRMYNIEMKYWDP